MDFLQLFFLRQKGHLSQSTYKKLKKQAIFFKWGTNSHPPPFIQKRWEPSATAQMWLFLQSPIFGGQKLRLLSQLLDWFSDKKVIDVR